MQASVGARSRYVTSIDFAGDPNAHGVPDIQVVISRLTDEELLNDSVVYRGKPVEWDKAAAADDTKPENDLLMMIRPMRILLYHKGTLVGECTAE